MKKLIKNIIGSVALVGLVGCGSESSDTVSGCFDASQETDTSVQWSKLMTENATKLSEYKLFEDLTDPTKNPQSRGLPYDLTVPLFTDYATKYRFVFVPPGCTAEYKADEVFDFPVGSVITKSFAMPSDTANRGIENEDLIETRLLIKRTTGWVALPYVWNSSKSDAILDYNGASFPTTLVHNAETFEFNYNVPDPQSCKNCHQIKNEGEDSAHTLPIGPKARFLNKDYAYDSGSENQLAKWVSEGLLSGVPTEASSVDQTPLISDETNIGDMTPAELQIAAKAWLDINCAHCHRRDPSGEASNTNMHVEWTRSYDTDSGAHGACALPISFGGDGGNDSAYIIEPGASDLSLMVFRMNTTDGGDRMPPLGRELIHAEGVELVKAWIDSLPQDARCRR